MIVVPPTTVTDVAAVPPNVTNAPAANPVPEIVTLVPPAVGPEAGETAVTIGLVFGVVPKNSDMFAAVAPAPGKLVRPTPSAVNRSRFWC